MTNKINKLRKLKLSEVNSKAIYEIISNYKNVENIPNGATKSASFEQLFFPPFRELMKGDETKKSKILEKIAKATNISQEKVGNYLYGCGNTYIPLIIKRIINLKEEEMEILRNRTQQVILIELRKYCEI